MADNSDYVNLKLRYPFAKFAIDLPRTLTDAFRAACDRSRARCKGQILNRSDAPSGVFTAPAAADACGMKNVARTAIRPDTTPATNPISG